MPVSVGELLAYLKLDSSGFDRGIRTAQTEMRTAAGTADQMSAAVGMTSTRLAGAGREAQVAASGSAKYRAAQLSLVAAQERYNAVLNQSNASAAKLASAEAAVIRANDRVAVSGRAAAVAVARQAGAFTETNAAAAATPGLMSRTATGFASAGRSALGLGAAFGVFELARKTIDISKEASEFQKSMLLIDTNANAGAAEVKAMTTAVLGMAGEVATKPIDLANALYHVEQNGLRGQKALEALRAGAEGAKIGLADVEDTTNTMTIAVASGIDGMGNLQKAMGTMIAIAGTGDMRLKDLNEALSGGILSVAKGYGATLQDVAAILATLGDNGLRGADAATQLRMVLMGFAAPAAKGKQALAGIGLSMTALRDDMEKHGLVHAMNDLEQHMTAAGITGAKVGGFITEAFGKKAGAGLAVLLGEMDRVNNKFEEGAKGAAGFAQKWEATTHTASFAFQKLGAQIEVAGIKIADKLLPAATEAANWLGTTLPHAVETLYQILQPTIHAVGDGLGAAWSALSGVLSVAAGALGTIGGALSSHRSLVTGIATAVLGMWAAYKGFRIASAAITAIDLALGRLAMRMNRTGGAMAGMQSGLSGLSTASVAGGAALAGIGIALYAYSSATSQAAAIAAQHKAEVDSLTQAIEQDSGALGKNTRAAVENMLVQNGMYRDAAKFGITQRTLTDALLGNSVAMATVAAKAHTGTVESTFFQFSLKGLTGELKEASQNAKDKAQADRLGAGASKAMGEASKLAAGATTKLKNAEQEAADAAKKLDTALQILSGRLGAHQALDQFVQGVQQLKSQLDKQNHSLVGNSDAAVKNRLAVDQVVGSLLSYGNALKQQGKTQPQINSALQKQSQYLIDNAKQMGITRGQLVNYLRTLHLTPSQIKTVMGVDDSAARAAIKAMQEWFNSLRWTAHVTSDGNVSAGTTGSKASARAVGGGLPEGVSAVGEAGPELAVKHGPHVEILSHSQSKAYAAATGMKIPGFASGTLNPHPFTAALRPGSSADERYAFTQMLAVGVKAGISSGLAKQLTDENNVLRRAITDRNRLADKLKADNQRLADAQKRLADEASAVRGAITGSFDVTSAGTGFDGQQPISGRNMLAEEKQAANRAHAFVSAIKSLKGKIGYAYLYQLAEKGPDALPEAKALLSLNRSDLKAFNVAQSSLNTSGSQLGSFIGNTRFGGEVARDKATVAADKRRLARGDKLVNHLGDRIIKQLEHGIEHLSHPKITVVLDGKKIATAVASGAKKNGSRN